MKSLGLLCSSVSHNTALQQLVDELLERWRQERASQLD